MNKTPSIYIKNDDLLGAIDELKQTVGVSRSRLITYLLSRLVDAIGSTVPQETATGLKYKVNVTLEFEGK